MRYTALVHKDRDTDYGVSFPDFPGCTAIGENFESALDSAAEALAFHVEGMLEDGEDIPEPSSIENIQGNADLKEDLAGAMVAIVPLVQTGRKIVRVNLSIDSATLEAIDAAAARRQQTRSAFIAETGLHEARRF